MNPTPANTLRAIVVDDEPLARRGLIDLLQQVGGVAVVGEAATGREGVELVHRLAPALVFLDIEMPDLDGFQMLRHLGPERRPAIVFVTAHERHAMTAFELDAADYLLKPFHAERLRRAVRRARALQRRASAGVATPSTGGTPAWQRDRHRFVVRDRDTVLFVEPAQIDWIESDGNYVTLHLGHEAHSMRETLAVLEARLDATLFVRISRSVIANAQSVRSIHRLANGQAILRLTHGTELRVSRRCRAAVEAFLNV
jgi:two-component system LytT family response regulator